MNGVWGSLGGNVAQQKFLMITATKAKEIQAALEKHGETELAAFLDKAIGQPPATLNLDKMQS